MPTILDLINNSTPSPISSSNSSHPSISIPPRPPPPKLINGYLDKLWIATNQRPRVEWLMERGFKYRPLRTGASPLYKIEGIYQLNKIKVGCFWQKNKPNQIWDAKVEINPRQFDAYVHFRNVLIGLIGDLNLSEHEITRVDTTGVIQGGISEINWLLRRTSLTNAQHFEHLIDNSGDCRGFAIGKMPRRLSVYIHRDNEIHFELQLQDEKVPIKQLDNIHQLVEIPYLLNNGLEIKEIDQCILHRLLSFQRDSEALKNMDSNKKGLLKSLLLLDGSINYSGLFMAQKFIKGNNMTGLKSGRKQNWDNFSRHIKYLCEPKDCNVMAIQEAINKGIIKFLHTPVD